MRINLVDIKLTVREFINTYKTIMGNFEGENKLRKSLI